MRRILASAAAAALVMAVPAAARGDDALEEYLERAAVSDFHARGVLICSWGETSAAASYEVSRSNGVSMVHGPDGDLLAGGGLSAVRTGTEWRALEIGSASSWRLSDRYALSTPRATSLLGRPATSYTVLEDGVPRVRLVVDDASSVPLLTEVLAADGEVFRLAVMVDFDNVDAMDAVTSVGEMPELTGMADMRTMTAVPAPDTFPEEVAGYRRADTYLAPGDTIHAFYTDGLFSFSVFEARRGATPEPFRSAATWEVGGEQYRRIVTPAHAWIQWHAPDRSYLLVGDLPPDHAAEVLAGLPQPGDRSWFVRLWRRLFG
jgi:hypothetical protein